MKKSISQQIKEHAYSLGFDACGFCKAEYIGLVEETRVKTWLDKAYNAEMEYMNNYFDKRCNPTLLVDDARSIISLALNYYPQTKQAADVPQFAYYAYGLDYHDVMKQKLLQLFDFIKSICPEAEGRMFCDTAPVLERFWAAKAGIGFIGKNSLLIIPQKGSFFFLGELIVNIELEYDEPVAHTCGSCTRCMDACPTMAITAPRVVDSNKCISYHTIENKGEIPEHIQSKLSNCAYGCDICQKICPWNRFAKPHSNADFEPKKEFIELTAEQLKTVSEDEYKTIFKGSAVKRAKYKGLMRNVSALRNNEYT